MAYYMITLINNGSYNQKEIVSTIAISAMQTPPEDIPSDYAMGWISQEQNGARTIRHNGAVDSFYADVILLPDEDIGITLMVNQNSLIPLAVAYRHLADGLVDTLLGQVPAFGLSLRLVYGILTAIILFDIFRHYRKVTRLTKC